MHTNSANGVVTLAGLGSPAPGAANIRVAIASPVHLVREGLAANLRHRPQLLLVDMIDLDERGVATIAEHNDGRRSNGGSNSRSEPAKHIQPALHEARDRVENARCGLPIPLCSDNSWKTTALPARPFLFGDRAPDRAGRDPAAIFETVYAS